MKVLYSKATHIICCIPKERRKIHKNYKEFVFDHLDLLFDICSCKCKRVNCDNVKCSNLPCDEIHLPCVCVNKVPTRELSFLFDQRTDRKMYIGGIDSHTSIILSKIEQRTISLKERIERKIKTEKAEPESYNYFEIEDKEETDTDSDVEYVDATSKICQNHFHFETHRQSLI